jgi:uncharacterized spore protein YtfJ
MSEENEAFLPKESSFVEGLAHRIGLTVNARYIYGEPVERDGVTVIPVAKAAYGFGGGGGKKAKEGGLGGGGGVMLTPVGYIEIKHGETRFRPTRDLLAVSIIAAAPLVWLAVWKITKLLKKSDAK